MFMPKKSPKGLILPPELDDDDEVAGGGIPDDDGWIHLEGKPNGLSEGDSGELGARQGIWKITSRDGRNLPFYKRHRR